MNGVISSAISTGVTIAEALYVKKKFSIIINHTMGILCLQYILWLYIDTIVFIPDTHRRGIVGWAMYCCIVGIIIVICILFEFLIQKIRSWIVLDSF